jgi:hypothetical protein
MTGGTIRVEDESIILRSGQAKVRIEAWGRDGIRVRATTLGEIMQDLPGSLLEQGWAEAEVSLDGKVAEIRNGATTVKVELEPLQGWPIPWRISFHDSDGRELLGEKMDRFRRWPGREVLRPGPAPARAPRPEGLRHRPDPGEHGGPHPLPLLQQGLWIPLEQPGDRTRRARN